MESETTPPPATTEPADAGPPTEVPKEHRQWAMFTHLSLILGAIPPLPILGLIVPIVLWQLKKEEMPTIDAHGKVVVNWVLSALIYGVVFMILSLIVIGIPLLIALGLCTIVFAIIGGIKANDGVLWKYPLSITFLK